MTKVYNSAVVLIPPEEKWNTIQKVRRQYDRNYHRWMPHITLLYPFRSEPEFNLLESDFQKICQNLDSFEVQLNSFNYFNHGRQRYTIWLKPTPKKPIIDLQKLIQSLTPDCNDVSLFRGGYTPHLSLGQISGKVLLDEVLQILSANWRSLQFIVDKFFFIAREAKKNSVFQVKKAISLSLK
jgi:2'-5' RNA ligase